MLVSLILAAWLAIMVASLVLWSRFHERARFIDGIDETAYRDGLDEISLREAA